MAARPPKSRPPKYSLTAPELSEKVRERNAVHTLQWLGYRVMTTGKPVPVVCRNCRVHQFAQTTGSSPGLADERNLLCPA